MDRERMLIDEDEGWRALRGVLGRVPEGRMEEPTVTPEGWSPKDVAFHVAAWLAEAASSLDRMREGTFDPDDDPTRERIERLNAEWFAVSRSMDVPSVRVGLEAARAQMLRAWAALPEITEDAWSWFDESGPRHYAEHVRDLERWLGEPSDGADRPGTGGGGP